MPGPNPEGEKVGETADIDSAELARELGAEEPVQQRIREQGAEKTLAEWMEKTDAPSGMLKIANVVQDFGDWMEKQHAQGSGVNPKNQQKVIAQLAEKYGVRKERALQEVQGILEEMNLGVKRGELEADMQDAPDIPAPEEETDENNTEEPT